MRWWLGSDGLGRGIARDGRMRLGESRVFEWENMVVCLVRMLSWYEFAGGFALGVGQF